MGRPLTHGLDWFRHDTDASSDEKVEILRHLYGNDGYAFYFIMLERIYRTDGQELDVADGDARIILARKVGVSVDRFDQMVVSAVRYGLFDEGAHSSRGVLTSSGIKDRAEVATEHRERMREAARKRREALAKQREDNAKGYPDSFGNNGSSHANNSDSFANNPPSIAEHSRAEQSTLEEEQERGGDARKADFPELDPNNPQHIPPDVETIIAEGERIGKSREDCERFHAHYGSQGWRKANNQLCTHWPLLLRSWCVNDASGNAPTPKRRRGNDANAPPPTIEEAWWIWSYETAADRAAREQVRDYHTRWVRLKGPDGKPWFVTPENKSRGIPAGWSLWLE